MTKISTTCLIPFYNENERLLVALENATQIKGLDEIICIDDGSSDSAGKQAKKKFPQITLIRLEENVGKAGAVKKGLEKAQGKNILMFDADYHEVNSQEIEEGLEFFQKNPSWGMILFKNLTESLIYRLCRTNVVTVGLRLLRKKDLIEIFNQPINRFEMEIAINSWMLKQRKKIGWRTAHFQSYFKYQKITPINGFWQDFKMLGQFSKYRGIFWFLWHLMTFCRQKAD